MFLAPFHCHPGPCSRPGDPGAIGVGDRITIGAAEHRPDVAPLPLVDGDSSTRPSGREHQMRDVAHLRASGVWRQGARRAGQRTDEAVRPPPSSDPSEHRYRPSRSDRPVPADRGRAMPSLRIAVRQPGCVPAGTSSECVVPSTSGMSTDVPNAASAMPTVTRWARSAPARSKRVSGLTMISTNRSPDVPFLGAASPSRLSRNRVPLSTPGGISTATSRSLAITPVPRQLSHGSGMMVPVPVHMSHVATVIIVPRIPRRWTRTAPAPEQVGQVSRSVPGRAPDPVQTSHVTLVRKPTFASTPKHASSRLTSTRARTSRPRGGPCRPAA